MEKQKEKDFDQFLSGESKQEEQTLQDLFKSYYEKASQLKDQASAKGEDGEKSEGVLNSAKQSLNSFSSKLEARRQKFMQEKQEADSASKGDKKGDSSAKQHGTQEESMD